MQAVRPLQTVRRILLPLASMAKSKPKKKPARGTKRAEPMLIAGFLLRLLFEFEDGSSTFPRNGGKLLPIYTMLHPTR
jgi:hypothetical protein